MHMQQNIQQAMTATSSQIQISYILWNNSNGGWGKESNH